MTRSKVDNPLIMNAANAYLRKRLHSQVANISKTNSVDSNEFALPQLLHFNRQQDEQNRLLSEIKNLVHNNTKAEDILVITTSNTTEKVLKALIEDSLEISTAVLTKTHNQKDHIGLCTLEFIQKYNIKAPYVFITGLNLLYASEDQFHEDPDKEYDLIVKNTRQLAIAMSRAKKELSLFITIDKIPKEFISPHIHIPTDNSETKAEVRYLHG